MLSNFYTSRISHKNRACKTCACQEHTNR